MSDINLGSICDELDDLALKILDVMQRIIDERDNFDNIFKSGFADIAKTRYVMGTNSVSLLQINESHMMALYKVHSEECIHNKISFKNFKVLNNEMKSESTTARRRLHKATDTLQSASDQNFQGNIQTENKDSSNYTGSHSDNEQNVLQSSNPLTWFGVLVPQSLRSAQSNFQQSVVISAHIASLQSELHSLLNVYRALKLQKKTIQSTAECL